MTNREYYKEQILDIACKGGSIAMNKDTHEICSCADISCNMCFFMANRCHTNIKTWSEQEYVPFVGGSKVPVDTPIYVSDSLEHKELRRYFAKFENGKVYAYCDGGTSWSASDIEDITECKVARLAEGMEF